MRNLPLILLCLVALAEAGASAVERPQVAFAQDSERSIRFGHNSLTIAYPNHLPVVLNALGNERRISFSVKWDPALLLYIHVKLGSGVPEGSSLTLNTNYVSHGVIGITVISPSALSAGQRNIVTFVTTATGEGAPVDLVFSNSPTLMRVEGILGDELPATFLASTMYLWIADGGPVLSAAQAFIFNDKWVRVPIKFSRSFRGFDGITSVNFSVRWDPRIFDFDSLENGTMVPPGSNVSTNSTMVAQGKLGVLMSGTSPYLDPITYHLIDVILRVRPEIASQYAAIWLCDEFLPCIAHDGAGNPRFPMPLPGFVNVNQLYSSTVSGTVLTAGGQPMRSTAVALTDQQGFRRVQTTGSFGQFSFNNVAHGPGYIVSVTSRRYRFTPRQLNVTANIGNISLVGVQ